MQKHLTRWRFLECMYLKTRRDCNESCCSKEGNSIHGTRSTVISAWVTTVDVIRVRYTLATERMKEPIFHLLEDALFEVI